MPKRKKDTSKYEEEFNISQYKCECGRYFPYEQGKGIKCPHCGAERKAYIEIKHDAGKEK